VCSPVSFQAAFYSIRLTLQVLKRLVPLQRGLFEDYVANFWCATHAFVKWKLLFPQRDLVRACTALTLTALMPSCMHQILKPSRLGLLYCMLNSSLAFFLFSYQVLPRLLLP
jgi:alpha-1,3-glucosyltransferase